MRCVWKLKWTYEIKCTHSLAVCHERTDKWETESTWTPMRSARGFFSWTRYQNFPCTCEYVSMCVFERMGVWVWVWVSECVCSVMMLKAIFGPPPSTHIAWNVHLLTYPPTVSPIWSTTFTYSFRIQWSARMHVWSIAE